jgi:hypothetical protein
MTYRLESAGRRAEKFDLLWENEPYNEQPNYESAYIAEYTTRPSLEKVKADIAQYESDVAYAQGINAAINVKGDA